MQYKMICKTIKIFVPERNFRKSTKKILSFYKTIRREIKIFIEDGRFRKPIELNRTKIEQRVEIIFWQTRSR